MTKHAQNRKRFGRRNFKQRYFRLTTHSFSYGKAKGKRPICDIPLTELVAVERHEERSFKMQNIFRVSYESFSFDDESMYVCECVLQLPQCWVPACVLAWRGSMIHCSRRWMRWSFNSFFRVITRRNYGDRWLMLIDPDADRWTVRLRDKSQLRCWIDWIKAALEKLDRCSRSSSVMMARPITMQIIWWEPANDVSQLLNRLLIFFLLRNVTRDDNDEKKNYFFFDDSELVDGWCKHHQQHQMAMWICFSLL